MTGAPLPAQAAAAAASTDPERVVVRSGDTLWAIAGYTLNDPTRYREIVTASRSKQPDGSHLVDADRIQPGWTLAVPLGAVRARVASQRSSTRSSKRSARAQRPKAAHIVSPVKRYRITNTFGMRKSYYASGQHTGLDLAAPTGTPVRAISAGTVTEVGWGGAYGNLTQIRHQRGFSSWYAHQSRQSVTVGQHVETGQKIGTVGSTGNSQGPHLHLEIRVNGRPVNPAAYLR
ncbi:peptidoglycan DD-metalloendopeptidase family protein [Mumia sp. zg.B53]|uniref:M23 family metallopeptidase n=1 Tax=Mumia sp. zg.B53 TaxID=2855449 RepID=UPI001C6DD661|nr:peptidoglycan DD-metalloendopeptidase family protein [Mumia sp. zg.B53]MBW9213272.1 peptidoglycan DD-metalloendopeptidase family protein [Mumia sp. zg.B53]